VHIDEADSERFVEVGSTLAGKYRIERVIGSGGMGVVVAAEHLHLREPVAIKFLLPDRLGREQQVPRFLREARAASRIKSPHVVRVHDVDVRSDGVPYIVMEYLAGTTLAASISNEGKLTPFRSVDLVMEACEALAEAHALGIVHRDLKPANWFLARGAGRLETLKVLDFGISKFLSADEHLEATTGAAVLGSPPYMSPEQLTRPDRVDARSDIWSIGVILYECLAGVTPFRGATVAELGFQILRNQPASLAELCPEAAPALLDVISRCLTTNADARYDSILELARVLAPHGTERAARALAVIEAVSRSSPPPNVRPRISVAETLEFAETGTLSATGSTARPTTNGPSEQRAPPKLRFSVLLAAAGGALGFYLLTSRLGSWPETKAQLAHAAAASSSARAAVTSAPVPQAVTASSPPLSASAPAPVSSEPSMALSATRRPRERRRAVSPAPSATAPPLQDDSTSHRDPVYEERK
jgi:serine/threonine-protein kinase